MRLLGFVVVAVVLVFSTIGASASSAVVSIRPGEINSISSNEAFRTVKGLPYVLLLTQHATSRMSKKVLEEIGLWASKCRPHNLFVFSADPAIVTDYREFLDQNSVRMEVIGYGDPKQYVYSGSGSVVFMQDGKFIGSEHGMLLTMHNKIAQVVKSKFPSLLPDGQPFCTAESQSAATAAADKTDDVDSPVGHSEL
eukprot:ANDGO_07912.mRNA.1 hypothetical protein